MPGLESFTGRILHVADYRTPEAFARQRVVVVGAGNDLHFWLTATGLDGTPLGRLLRAPPAQPRPRRRPLPCRARGGPARTPAGLHRPRRQHGHLDGRDDREPDAATLSTGYRPHLPYLTRLDDALDSAGRPRHRDGASLVHPGLAFEGMEGQRSLSSYSPRGVGRDSSPGGPPPRRTPRRTPRPRPPGSPAYPSDSTCVNIDVCRM
ncbi:hypothetical protein ACFYYS_28375 [Streptomyces sp. NPDC002120]|uniref:hypothetical protein n=1 Tax=Streptomyces sp. NPDC002120 TaxID=3364631 RepID=UPI00368795A2